MTTPYEAYCSWAGMDAMPEGVFAMLRESYPQVGFRTLHRWWLSPLPERTDAGTGEL